MRVVVIFLALVAITASGAAAQDAGLFVPVETAAGESAVAAARAEGAGDSTTIRERLVEIDFSQLDAFDSLASSVAASSDGPAAEVAVPAARLRLNLFEDAVVTAVVDRVVPTPSGYALWGNLEGIDLGTLTLVVNGTVVTGTVRSPGGTYVIEPSGDGFAVRQVDLSREAPEHEPLPWPPPEDPSVAAPVERGPDGEPFEHAAHGHAALPAPLSRRSLASASRTGVDRSGIERTGAAQTTPDDGSVIDLLVLYTEAARRGAGGTAQIEAKIDSLVAETNQAYAASGVALRVAVAWREEVDYVEGPHQQEDLDRLTGRSDGWLDHVHDLRDVYAADIVHLIYERNPGESTGIAWQIYEFDADAASSAFSLSNRRASAGIFAHELGHNMGLEHDRYVAEKGRPSCSNPRPLQQAPPAQLRLRQPAGVRAERALGEPVAHDHVLQLAMLGRPGRLVRAHPPLLQPGSDLPVRAPGSPRRHPQQLHRRSGPTPARPWS